VIADPGAELIAITTRHDSHAAFVAQALEAGKAVYVEKPLALDWDGLALVRGAQESTGAPLIVGFNRRHSPYAEAMRALGGPRLMSFRVNAGRLPPGHWVNDPARGGGRLLGEGCHFVDFLCDQAGCDPIQVMARGFASDSNLPLASVDNFSLQLTFADGSVGSLSYAADAPTGAGKERFETSTPGGFGLIDDFKGAALWDGGRRRRIGRRRQDKGFEAQYSAIARIARREQDPPPPDSFYVTTLATLAALRSLETGRPEPVVEA
jgi:predicted dehydrogenase